VNRTCHGDERTFSLCTFLYVDALARAGWLDDAVAGRIEPMPAPAG